MKYSLRSLMIAVTLLAIALGYIGSYVRRSSRGIYEPSVVGASGVKWYDWAPEGFVKGDRWDAVALRFYYPLWRTDRRFWHRPLYSGEETNYPISLPTSSAPVPDSPKEYKE